MCLCHTEGNSRRDPLVNGTTSNANPSANTQPVASEHSTPANTHVANKNDLDCSKPTSVRPNSAGKKGRKRQNVFCDNQGFPDSSDLFDRYIS
jgi:hypothetical protein